MQCSSRTSRYGGGNVGKKTAVATANTACTLAFKRFNESQDTLLTSLYTPNFTQVQFQCSTRPPLYTFTGEVPRSKRSLARFDALPLHT